MTATTQDRNSGSNCAYKLRTTCIPLTVTLHRTTREFAAVIMNLEINNSKGDESDIFQNSEEDQ